MAQPDDPRWLADVVAPVSVAEFLSRHWLREPLFCRGARDRFSPLLTWTDLNAILERHWRETKRFRLARQGRDLDPASYADLGGSPTRVRPADVTEHLRRGATLSFEALDEVHEPLRRLAESFEAFFRASTQINVYAAWRALHGLDLHRDDHEVFVLHLDGCKRWLLYGSDIDGMETSELRRTSAPPPGAIADVVLEPGALLYIPRGCYHVAVPMNQAALHLTIGVRNPRGIDLLTWMVGRVRASDIAARDVPVLAAGAEQRRYVEDLQRALLSDVGPDALARYFAETSSNAKPRPTFNLPWSATPDGLPPGRDFRVKLHGFRSQIVDSGEAGGTLEIGCGARRWRFPRATRLILDQLSDGMPQGIDRLLDAVAGRMDEATLRMLVGMLVRENLVLVLQ